MSINMNANELTSWTSYPDKYKFFSLHFYLNQDVNATDRSTYDLLDLVSDIGGILEVVVAFFALISVQLQVSHLRLKALLTNRLF